MWRSFFYAVGIGLFGLGVQGLVLDQVLVPKDTKLQKLIRKVVSDDGPRLQNLGTASPQSAATGASTFPGLNQQSGSLQSQNSRFANYNSGSRYGPSRFSGPAYGTGYGGGRVGSSAVNGSNYGNNAQGRLGNTQLAGYEANRNGQALSGQRAVGGLQNLVIREWMPWSLLASGAIIFLYTRTMDRRRHHD